MAGVSTAGDNAAGASELGAHAFFAAVSTTLTKLFLSQWTECTNNSVAMLEQLNLDFITSILAHRLWEWSAQRFMC